MGRARRWAGLVSGRGLAINGSLDWTLVLGLVPVGTLMNFFSPDEEAKLAEVKLVLSSCS